MLQIDFFDGEVFRVEGPGRVPALGLAARGVLVLAVAAFGVRLARRRVAAA